MFHLSPMFDAIFKDFRPGSPMTRMDATPPMDVYRRDDKVIVHIDLPGVATEDVSLDVENGWIVVSAERTYSPEPGDTVYLTERPFGRFERRFKVGAGLDSESVSAKFKNGVLTLTISALEQTKRSPIAIESGEES